MSPKPASSTVEVLTTIWQRVLQRPSIGIHDHFFSVGGDFHTADMLFAAIAQECGHQLPSATIYHAPTVAQLARLLDQPALPRFSPFVEVKAGSEQPPILIVHGLAGTVPFFELAHDMATNNHPVYGIQSKGVDGMEEPLDRVEDMAAFYLRSLREIQPHGPYLLIGYSFGGLVALEMAQSLRQVGECVALLALVDAYPDARYMLPGQRLRLRAQRVGSRIADLQRRSVRAGTLYIVRRLKHRLSIGGVDNAGNLPPGASRLSFEQTTPRVKEKAYLALARYRPQFYGGKIKFVKSESDSYYPANPAAVWAKLTAEFECDTVPGGHFDVVTGDIKSLAAVLTRYVTEALRSK
ncbi:MAG: alpha/beta fold hydrolase [Candidatus Sulfotelmatobacter sp.]